MSDRDIMIGLEIHIGLNTNSKMFCSCPTEGEEIPNSRVCPICLGHPGSKPVFNKKVLEYAIKLCLALECKLATSVLFSRKSYFYPDLSKNYQITQYEVPLGSKGKLRLKSGKEIRLTRIHMEEDPASLVHTDGIDKSKFSLIDYNRSGTPLLEIVTEPDLSSPEEAREFMKQLITILGYLEIFDENKNVIKADINVSIKESNFTRAEIKNVTGFRDIEKAIFYEVDRQKEAVKKETLKQETRSWNAETGVTTSLRTKETEADYGYIFDPDLVEIDVDEDLVSQIKKHLPELAEQKINKFTKLGIDKADAEILAQERLLAELYEEIVKQKINPVVTAKWLRRELLRVLNYNNIKIEDNPIQVGDLVELLQMIQNKEISDRTGQEIIEKLVEKPFSPKEYVKEQGLAKVSDNSQIEQWCNEAISESQKAVESYRAGEEKSLNFIVGVVMKKSKGTAAPDKAKEMLISLLK